MGGRTIVDVCRTDACRSYGRLDEAFLGIALIVHDPLYGRFETPSFLDPLLHAPEFRRLSEVRLININSTTLAALSETRRYSHTLGVLRLALLNPLMGLDEEGMKAFLASIIIHDAGTPAFAHLMEYHLKERYDWNHEAGASDLLFGENHPDRLNQQVYETQTPQFRKLCRHAGIDFESVITFMNRSHPHSKLIFGSLDFDNLDNVARMAWMLGRRFDISSIETIAANIAISESGQLALPQGLSHLVREWLQLRREAYEILVLDGPTVAAQAVLSQAIEEGLETGFLELSDWLYDDRRLLEALQRTTPSIKRRLHRDFFGALPRLCLLYWDQDPSGTGFPHRAKLINLVKEFVGTRFGGSVANAYGYVFRDRGSLSRRITFLDSLSGDEWSVGEASDSLVVYGFAKGPTMARTDAEHVGREFFRWMQLRT